METSDITPGMTVRLPGKAGTATVAAVGRCTWPSCRHGDECVEVTGPSRNYPASKLRPI